MALNAAQQWWIRTDGSELNGGGYDATVSGAGTNYSDQAAAQLALTDLACLNTTTLTSVTGGFTSAMIGNIIRIASGTNFTAGYYMVTARTNTNTVTLDRNPTTGANASAGVGKLGGAWADIRNLATGGDGTGPLVTSPLAVGHTANIRGTGNSDGSADYTQNGYYRFDGVTADFNVKCRLVGYNGRPCIKTTGDCLSLHLWPGTITGIKCIMDGATHPTNGALSSFQGLFDCVIDQAGFDTAITYGGLVIVGNFAKNTGTKSTGSYPGFTLGNQWSPDFFGSVVAGNTVVDIRGSKCFLLGTGSSVVGNVVARGNFGSGAAVESFNDRGDFTHIFHGNTLDSNSGDGLLMNDLFGISEFIQNGSCCNNIFTNNGGYGINATTAADAAKMLVDYNNFYNNSSGAMHNLTAGAHDQAVNPQYVDAPNNNFTPQNTLLKGAAIAQVMGAATNYQWLGAIQALAAVIAVGGAVARAAIMTYQRFRVIY